MFKLNYHNKTTQYFVLVLLAIIWGSSFILMKKGLQDFDSVQLAAFRLFVAYLALLPIAFKHLPKFKNDKWGLLLLSALLGSVIPAYLFAQAQTNIDSALAGILNAFVPGLTVVFGLLFFKQSTSLKQVLGILIGLLGVIGLIWSNASVNANVQIFYVFMVILATMCYAFNINVLKSCLGDFNGVEVASLSFLFVGPICLVLLVTSDFFSVISYDTLPSMGYIALLGLSATAFAIIIFNDLIRASSAVFSSSVTYLIPVVAIFWGLVLGENITFLQIVFTAVILIGVFLINRGK